MAVIKAVSSKAGIGQALDYVTKEEKTEDKLVSGLHCEPDTVKDEMQATKELWGKTGGRTYKHFVQSYHEDEHIIPPITGNAGLRLKHSVPSFGDLLQKRHWIRSTSSFQSNTYRLSHHHSRYLPLHIHLRSKSFTHILVGNRKVYRG